MFDQGLRRFHPRQTSNQTDANGCIYCDTDTPPSCSCGLGTQCVLINRYDLIRLHIGAHSSTCGFGPQ